MEAGGSHILHLHSSYYKSMDWRGNGAFIMLARLKILLLTRMALRGGERAHKEHALHLVSFKVTIGSAARVSWT